MKKDIMKVMLKAGVAWQEKAIPDDLARKAIVPMTILGDLIVEYCRMSGTVDPAALSAAIKAAHDVLLELLKHAMKEKNYSRFTAVAEYVRSDDFLRPFFNDEAYREYKETVMTHMASTVELHGSRVGETEFCAVRGCLLPKVDLRGSNYCKGHHALKYSTTPKLQEFLKNEDFLRFLQAFIVAIGKRQLLELLLKVRARVCG